VADIFQGAPNPATVTTDQTATSAPEFYTNYLQDVANLGQAAVQQGGVAGFSPLQQQALNLAPQVAFSGIGSAGTGQEYLTASGATPATSMVNQYMDPYMQNVVGEMGRLQQRAIQENFLPNLRAGAAGTGQFGSQRAAQIAGQSLRDLQADLLGRQYGALSEGYKSALGTAQADLSRQLQAGQALGQLGQTQQGMGTTGLKTLTELGGMEQGLGQRVLDQPMKMAQDYSKLLQQYVVPTTVTKQTIGSTGYANSPLAQITGLLAGLGSFRGTPDSTTIREGGTGNPVLDAALNLGKVVTNTPATRNLTPQQINPRGYSWSALAEGGSVSGYADGGTVNPQVAYTDGQGNYYDANGYLVE
jgi:hypothetical protein